MRTNLKPKPVYTHEGARTSRVSAFEQLQRSVLACLLWEDGFYESGVAIADRIKSLVAQCDPDDVAGLAIKARAEFKLRHAPLLLVRELARDSARCAPGLISMALSNVIQRADELPEFLSLYWKEKKVPLSKQVKKGLARAFCKFDEYQLAKYNRDNAIKLRDVLFMVHAKPQDEAQAELWKRLVDGNLAVPDTWEVALSGGANKKEAWERLLYEGKLGYMALLRNLRNMSEAGVSSGLIKSSILEMRGAGGVLPFRYIAAAKAAPQFESELDTALVSSLGQSQKLSGRTIVIVDVSGSMYNAAVSQKSDMTRASAACALAAILREVCEDPVIYATAGSDRERKHKTAIVPSRSGIALVDAIYAQCAPLGGGGIFLKQVMDYVHSQQGSVDRVIVITDEQDCGISNEDSPGRARSIADHNYILNVATYACGIGYGAWTHINGFSESVVRYLCELEKVGQ